MQSYQPSEPYIFVSYAHKDKSWVLPIIESLSKKGFRVWYDASIEVGSEWPQYIAEHLLGATVFLAFVSEASIASQNCAREITMAIDRRKDFITVYRDENMHMPAGLELQLGITQAVFYNRYAGTADFVSELSKARFLQPCLTADARRKQEVLAREEEAIRREAQQREDALVREQARAREAARVRAKAQQQEEERRREESRKREEARKYAREQELQTKRTVIGLILLGVALLSVVLIFISRETAFIGLALLIVDTLVCAALCLFTEYYNMLTFCLMAGCFFLAIFAAIYGLRVWGTAPIAVDTDEETVIYYLNRADGTLTAEYQEGATVLKKFHAPNADTIVIEEGYTELSMDALAKCKDADVIYIPSSVETLQDRALACKGIKEVYIGYNSDGTKAEQLSALSKLGIQIFADTNIKTVYFNGTVAQWEAIEKRTGLFGWDSLTDAFEVVCNDGTLTCG